MVSEALVQASNKQCKRNGDVHFQQFLSLLVTKIEIQPRQGSKQDHSLLTLPETRPSWLNFRGPCKFVPSFTLKSDSHTYFQPVTL